MDENVLMRDEKSRGPVSAMEPGSEMAERVGAREVRRGVVVLEESWKWRARTAMAPSVCVVRSISPVNKGGVSHTSSLVHHMHLEREMLPVDCMLAWRVEVELRQIKSITLLEAKTRRLKWKLTPYPQSWSFPQLLPSQPQWYSPSSQTLPSPHSE